MRIHKVQEINFNLINEAFGEQGSHTDTNTRYNYGNLSRKASPIKLLFIYWTL